MIKGWQVHFAGRSNRANLILLSAALLAFAFLGCMIAQFVRVSLQMDFSAYYSAGASLNHGFSPYVNNLAANPSIWDGVSKYATSRFLYFPLVGNFFQLFAVLPYHIAKVIWSLLNLAAMFYIPYCVSRMVGPTTQHKIRLFLFSVIGLCLFFPTYAYFERGQIDFFTLLFLVKGIEHLKKDQPRKSGVFFALAMLIKVNIIMLVPILLIKKYRKAIPTLILMAGIFGALTLSLNRWEVVKEYVVTDFPRILKYNELGPQEQTIPESERVAVNGGYALTNPHIQGVGYELQYFSFSGNAALSRVAWFTALNERLTSAGIPLGNLSVNLLFYLASAGLCAWLVFGKKVIQCDSQELIFWGFIVTLILLISPLTWLMNLVWLGMLLPVMGSQMLQVGTLIRSNNSTSWRWILGLIPGVIGWLLIALPETWLAFNKNEFGFNKAILGEVLILVWLVLSMLLLDHKSRLPLQYHENYIKENKP